MKIYIKQILLLQINIIIFKSVNYKGKQPIDKVVIIMINIILLSFYRNS